MPRGAYSSQHAVRPPCAARFSAGAADAAGELQVPWYTATGSAGATLRAARGPAPLRRSGRLRVLEPAVQPGPRPERSLRGTQPLLPPSLVPRRGPRVKLGGSVTNRSEERSQNRPCPCDPTPRGPCPFGSDISFPADTAQVARSLPVGDLAAGWRQSWGRAGPVLLPQNLGSSARTQSS